MHAIINAQRIKTMTMTNTRNYFKLNSKEHSSLSKLFKRKPLNSNTLKLNIYISHVEKRITYTILNINIYYLAFRYRSLQEQDGVLP